MAQANVCVRMDKKIKEQFAHLCNELGLTISMAVNLFAKAAIRTKSIPFALSIDDYNEETRKAIEETEKGIDLAGPFDNMNDFIKSIEAGIAEEEN